MLNFRTTFVNKKGEVVFKSKTIAKHYLRGWFLVDILAALPFDLLYAANLYTRVSIPTNMEWKDVQGVRLFQGHLAHSL